MILKITPVKTFFLSKRGPSYAGPFYAGPNNAKRPKLTPLRAGVIRANKVLRTGVERSMSNIVEIYRRIRNISPGLKAKCGGLIFRGDYIWEENCVSEAYIGQNLGW